MTDRQRKRQMARRRHHNTADPAVIQIETFIDEENYNDRAATKILVGFLIIAICLGYAIVMLMRYGGPLNNPHFVKNAASWHETN